MSNVLQFKPRSVTTGRATTKTPSATKTPLYDAELVKHGQSPEEGLEVRLDNILAAASVAYQKGNLSLGDRLLKQCRQSGFDHWIRLSPEDCEVVLGTNSHEAISGEHCGE